MRRFALVIAAFCILLTTSALARKAAKEPVKPDKLRTCYELGVQFGHAWWALNDAWRGKAELFERYCTTKPRELPPPSDDEVAQLLADLTNFARTVDTRPLINYQQLQQDLKPGNDEEGRFLDGMLRGGK